jgi:hypothetical protein
MFNYLFIILDLFSSKELLRVAEISLAFYRFGNLEELWREICFDKWEGNVHIICSNIILNSN